MLAFRRNLMMPALSAIVIAMTGCSDPPPPPPANSDTPPPAQTSDQISEQERLKQEAEKAQREKQRRIERNRTAIDDLMFTGMTVAEANEALGVVGVKDASIGSGAREQVKYEWKLEGGFTITATFMNGKLTEKEMSP